MKESHSKGIKMTRMEKAKENALDVEIQIISPENAQNHQEAIIKEFSLEEHGVIAMNTMKKRLKTKIVLWLKHPMRTDHGWEFDNDSNGISHNFSAPRTPQSNGVVERKNRTLQEMSRTIKCFILNTKDYLTEFDPKSYEGVFLGYSQNSKAYIILNKQTMKVEESLNVTFDKTPPPPKTSPSRDDDLVEEEAIEVNKTRPLGNDLEDKSLENNEIINIKESKSHPLENVIGNLNQRTLRSQAQDKSNFFCFRSTIKPKNINEALKDESWVISIQEELNQFISNDVWELVPNPKDMTIIETK
ncbi:retrovirus-related pol polyprotein from transposon TNT 1-94 [Tanacetum coccineum]